MHETQTISIRRITDAGMTLLLILLMAKQVTGDQAHEWTGMAMTVLTLVHQYLNRKWYGALTRGKYGPYRLLVTTVSILLIISFILTAFCGMSMSEYAVPFLYSESRISFSREMHLAMSHWAFVLMGIHLGLHVPQMTASLKQDRRTKKVTGIVSFCIAAGGMYLFLRNRMPEYMFFQAKYALLDYDRNAAAVFLENTMMLAFWVYAGCQAALACRNRAEAGRIVKTVLAASAGIALNLVIPAAETDGATISEQDSRKETVPAEATEKTGEVIVTEPTAVDDGYLLIHGGTFLMGSPETENWRISDETQHEVTVSDFYIDAFETTQEEYERLTGTNPSAFRGSDLPAENISWSDAVRFANAKSLDAGLTPVYTIRENSVIWDMSADGYRLPTESEWEYACRAGTVTPFNTEKSIDASEANFYGHYPYEIEENYFNNSVLEAKPGEYRQTTVPVGSFEPNAWGLYDCHGNINEWCWDYYGEYPENQTVNPVGNTEGTRHVYRGGGWNDFAKNMRSAYRAAGQADMKSYNLGIRLVRNAGSEHTGTAAASEQIPSADSSGKVLIAYFSWGGNTRGIAQQIRKQTGAEIFEITPLHPYSSDYNTVLMEAQEDQHRQARPELSEYVEHMEDYDVILLGYPNWWASIPMPVASFLEEYDFSGKRIIPFCSHGGGRFGQSLTAIAKLAPDADIGTGLSVHYSGGSSLPDDITAWLEANGIEH